jgi:mono/diheme cytochrome c family protein
MSRYRLFHLRTLPPAAIALAACSGSALAQTGDPVAGAALYVQRLNFPVSGPLNCADCHGDGPIFRSFFQSRGIDEAGVLARINGAIAGNSGGMNVYSVYTTQNRADVAAYIMRGPSAPPPPPPFAPPPGGTPPAATPAATPNPVMFNSTTIGSTSTVVNILINNASAAPVTFGSPAVVGGGGNAGDFLVAAPTSGTAQCISGFALGPGMSCSIGAQFAPTASGTRSAAWTVNFTGGVAPRSLSLQGTATTTSAPAPAPAPTPAPAPSAANAPTSGGGGAFGWLNLLALAGLAGLRRRR